MPTNQASTLLTYANLQMAAEATRLSEVVAGTLSLSDALQFGNNRSSKFTPTQAAQFVQEWKVLDHRSNTGTGFSGTLFEYIGTNTDPSFGPVLGQRVIGFRSTEFADDAARDNQATNQLEVAELGWAFGQIADMKKWVDSLYASGKITTAQSLAVTGYSLGGHLATAFNLLFPGDADATYTFNGAGVGTVNTGRTLAQLVAEFEEHRNGVGLSFSSPGAAAKYAELSTTYNGTTNAPVITDALILGITTDPLLSASEQYLFANALARTKSVAAEVVRVNGVVNSGTGGDPTARILEEVEAAQFDYQVAVGLAGQSTSAYRTTKVLAGWDAFRGRNPWPGGELPNFFDVFGANPPSAVANSQYHYGQAVPVFIEDQPLVRGSVLLDVLSATWTAGEAKLLVSNFSVNDFGDTHSLVLIVDSLSLQNALVRLDPAASTATLNGILLAASNAKKDTVFGTQGKAEGDVLERTLDAMRRMLLDPAASATPASLEGNTWADPAARATFHQRLKDLMDAPAFGSIKGKVSMTLSDASYLRSQARSDFAAFLALQALSPMTLKPIAGQAAAVEAALAGGAMAQVYSGWAADKNLTAEQRASGMATYSDRYYSDRAGMLDVVLAINLSNLPGGLFNSAQEQTVYFDAASQTQLVVGGASMPADPSTRKQIWFGGDLFEAKTGSDRDDRLYGGGNNDTLTGLAGADWLEGNTGDDRLVGGAGNDTLLGGKGDDFLEGSANDDSLLGGQGNDTYVFSSGWGHDVIEDSDGQGELRVPGYDSGLPIGKKVPGMTGAYRSADGKVRYVLGSDGKTLTIGFDDRSDSIVVRNWQSGQLGITFDETAPPQPLYDSAYTDPIGQTGALTIRDATPSDGGPAAVRLPTALATTVAMYGMDGADQISTVTRSMYYFVPSAQMVAQVTPDFHRDYVDGGEGNDTIYTGDGRDTVLGGAGDDVIFAGLYVPALYREGFKSIMPIPNDDQEGRPEDGNFIDRSYYFNTGQGESEIEAIVERDFFESRREYDSNVVDAGDGDDAVYSGWGDDVVHGGNGDDFILGQAGDDAVYGDDGADLLYGDSMSVHILQEFPAGTGNVPYAYRRVEPIFTPADLHGQDTLDGGGGDDWMWGMGADDTLLGGAGNDSLFGDTEYVPLDDEFLVPMSFVPNEFHGSDFLDGGDGADQLVGGAHDDRLFGGSGNDRMWGDTDKSGLTIDLHGDDTLDGGEGDDSMMGGGGSDEITGGIGNDSIFGDDAESIVAASAHGDDTIEAGDGDDTVFGGGGSDFILGGAGADQIAGDGGTSTLRGDDWIDGGDGDDLIFGDGGDDWIQGGAGADSLRGGDGNDTLEGDAGNDDLNGGRGNDTYRFGLGDGADTIDNTAADSALSNETLELEVGASGAAFSRFGSELLIRLNDSDVLQVKGQFTGTGIDQVVFADGTTWTQADIEDHLVAGTGSDADDLLGGTAGGDVIVAGAGDDQIRGEAGADQLIGGAGSDTYYFDVGFGADVVDERATDPADDNWIVLGPGLHTGNVQVNNALTSNQQYDLLINALGNDGFPTGNDIVVRGFFDQPNANSSIDGIRFADGTEWTAEWIHQHFYAEPGSRQGNAFSGKYTNDTLIGLADDEFIVGLAGNDSILGGGGNDYLHGDNGNDTVDGGVGDDHVFGDAGSDLLKGGVGNDTLNGGSGDDVFLFARGGGQDVVDEVPPTPGDSDTIRFDAGILPSDIQVVHSLIGGALYPDRLSLRISGTADEISTADWWTGTDLIGRVEFADGTVWSAEDVRARLSTTGSAASETLFGTYAADTIRGGLGSDFLGGGRGGDTYLLGVGDGSDVIYQEVRNSGENVIRFDAGIDPNSVVVGRNEQVVFLRYTLSDAVTIFDWGPYDSPVVQRVEFADGTVWQPFELLDRATLGTPGGDLLSGTSLNEHLRGLGGSDLLVGAGGDDLLDGGADLDELHGDNGNDTYFYRSGDGYDVIVNNDASAETIDTLRFDSSITPSMLRVMRDHTDLLIKLPGDDRILFRGWVADDAQQIDRVEFSDGTVWDAAGLLAQIGGPTEDFDWLVGTGTADVIDALAGVDRVYGEGGDDTLSGGADEDELFGGDGDDHLNGDAGYDYLSGDEGADTLNGGSGDDALLGGSGVDTYEFAPGYGHDFAADLTEADGSVNSVLIHGVTSSQIVVSRTDSDLYLLTGGTDRIALAEWFEGSESRAFRVQLDDGTNWTPTALEARIDGAHATPGDDVLYGTSGNDVVLGLAGNDILSGGSGADVLRAGDGDDTLFGSLGSAVLDAGDGEDYLSTESTGQSFFAGRAGDDFVRLSSSVGQVVAFNVGDGHDGVELSFESGVTEVISIGGGAQVSDLWFCRTPGSSDLVIGVGASDSLVLESLLFRDDAPAVLLQLVGASGTSVFDLSAAVAEFATVPDTDPNLAHWAAQSALLAHQSINNGSQAYGGRLAFQYGVNGSFATVSDLEAQWLLSQPGFATTLRSTQSSGISGTTGNDSLTGSTGADLLLGFSGNDTLNGGVGNDSMVGGSGNDTYVVDSAGDVIAELANEGVDVVQSSVTYTLPVEVENLTLTGSSGLSGTGNALDNVLTGNTGANTLTGGAGNDRLDGGSGNDTMAGGTGNDTYVVNVSTDVVTELTGEGTDTVESSVTLSLASIADVENLTLTGTATTGTGNTLDNIIIGNASANTLNGGAGNDRLDGGSGNDTMVGGTGNDTFVVNVSTDVITEAAGEGTDTIESAVTLTLGSGNTVENLTLTGSNAINGTGNGLGNLLLGNSGANTLAGLAGNDTYDGGGGNDALTDNSTTSNDVYRWGIGSGIDTVADSGGSDRVELAVGITAGQLVFMHVGNNLEVTVSGNSADKLVVSNWYVGTANRIEDFRLSDGSSVPAGQLPALVLQRGTFAASSESGFDSQRQTIQPVRWSQMSATQPIPAAIASTRWQLGLKSAAVDLSLDAMRPGSDYLPRPDIGQSHFASQVQALISTMAAFTGDQAAAGETERQTIQPVHRPDPMWVSPALM